MTTIDIYKRLMVYSRPYWKRLTLGILAGFLTGSSVLGGLTVLPNALAAFRGEEAIAVPKALLPMKDWLVEKLEPLATVVEPVEPDPQPGAASDTLPASAVPDAADAADAAAADPAPANDVDKPVTAEEMAVLTTLLFLVLIFLAGRSFFTFVNRYYMRWVGARVVLDLRNDVFSHCARQSLGFFTRGRKGGTSDMVARIVNDTARVENAVSGTIADLSRAPAELAGVAVALIIICVRYNLLGVILLAGIATPLTVLPIVVLGRRVRRHTRSSLQRISVLIERMQETFQGIRVVKAFHTEEREIARFRSSNEDYFVRLFRSVRAELFMRPAMELVTVLLVLILAPYALSKNVRIDSVVALILSLIVAYDPLKRLAKVNVQIQQALAASERVFELMDTHVRLPEAPNAHKVTSFDSELRFEELSFTYDGTDDPVLQDINLTIPKGHVVAFVGQTGSGKSTLAHLLARFYDPSSGRITLDGEDLRQLELVSLRRQIGIVAQDTFLFNDTIAANIAYGRDDATPEQIEAAARQAKCYDFIMEKAGGFDSIVGEGGSNLSGGQKQRLAIARTLLCNPPILILDEATSSLDNVTEQLVQEALNTLMEDRTVFAIAHRLSTVRHAHCIYVLDRGRIVEQGTHDELLAMGGVYRRLHDSGTELT